MKNKILLTITAIAIIADILAILSLENSIIGPTIVAAVCTAWLGLFGYANARK